MSYKPNKQQIKALVNGATALVEPVDKVELKQDAMLKWWWKNKDGLWDGCPDMDFIEYYSPLQVGDTFIVEEYDFTKSATEDKPSKKEHTFKVLSVEIKKVKDISIDEIQSIMKNVHALDYMFGFEDWFDEQYSKGAYEADPYVFYTVVKEI